MTRTYSLVVEPSETGYAAYVPELPTILVTGRTMGELTQRAEEAIRMYLEEVRRDAPPTSVVQEIEVELAG